ncbi:hypothetical protein [Streptomyces sp. NPDC026589]|uniref:hypothetical protein n=1 Tax=Streptomyces sp. NPDC026589 TaxID=3155609 RepID=UPI0033EB2EE4
MSENPSTRNELSGNVGGSVVQAGSVHGDMVFNSHAGQRSPEELETERRWTARRRAILDEEEAEKAAGQRRAERYVRACRLRWRLSLALLPVAVATMALGAMTVLPMVYAVLALPFTAVLFLGWARNMQITRDWDAGRTVKVPTR